MPPRWQLEFESFLLLPPYTGCLLFIQNSFNSIDCFSPAGGDRLPADSHNPTMIDVRMGTIDRAAPVLDRLCIAPVLFFCWPCSSFSTADIQILDLELLLNVVAFQSSS